MTNEEMDRAIAEHLGWSDLYKGPYDKRHSGRYKDHKLRPIPSFSNDLNAMYEAENTLATDQCWLMARELDAQCGVAGGMGSGKVSEWAWHATAYQRAQAFLRTVGKWRDE